MPFTRGAIKIYYEIDEAVAKRSFLFMAGLQTWNSGGNREKVLRRSIECYFSI